MHSIILCGGSGTRLWPLSRKNYPKQFLKLYSDKSLLQETFIRINSLIHANNIYFVTNKENYFNVFNQIRDIYYNFPKDNILVEPISLNTAPAISLAIKFLTEIKHIPPHEPIIALPSDHCIRNNNKYIDLLQIAISELSDKIGTIGITPTKPETEYGYIKKGQKNKNHFIVEAFKEKPDKLKAEEYMLSGDYVWNAGMYIFNAKSYIQEINKHCPEIFNLLKTTYSNFKENFGSLTNISIDYAITEKSERAIVFEGDFGWTDIGSFDALADITKNNEKLITHNSKNIFAHSENNRLIAAVGVEDLIIIETNDSILIQKKGESSQVKEVVNKLKEKNIKELEHNLIVHRPWGKFEILMNGEKHKAKKITVYPNEKLSLQAHYHRAEHWIVVSGVAKIINGEKEETLKENESTFIPAYTRHRLENPGKINLEIIEVQTGDYLEEDDIIRYDDIYDR
ncbi:mannose-1-phosphate guanylyltransferase/mannose-6-phosphate isomerase [Patescibacteria group bacterium]|nr:mannose-1-phosphate guanylyltransferase/mannose-6-phosphate isomerase [Patescibacteria group bacterium]